MVKRQDQAYFGEENRFDTIVKENTCVVHGGKNHVHKERNSNVNSLADKLKHLNDIN